MSQSKKPFDLESFFKKRIQKAEGAGASQPWSEPDDDVWDQIERSLPSPKKKRKPLLPWILVALLLFVSAWLLFQNRSLHKDIANLEKQKTALENETLQVPVSTGLEMNNQDLVQNRASKTSSGAENILLSKNGQEVELNTTPDEKTSSAYVDKATPAGNDSVAGMGNANRMNAEEEDNQRMETIPLVEPRKEKTLSETSIALDDSEEKKMQSADEGTGMMNSRSHSSINPIGALPPVYLKYERKEKFDPALPAISLTRTTRQNKRNGWSLAVAYEPTFAKLKNTNSYPSAPEFRGIDDVGVWSDAFSLRISKEISSFLALNAGVRYGSYQYQTAYYVSLPYNPLNEVEGNDGNFTSDFNHSFPSPVGDMEASFGLLRLAKDDILPQTILDLDLHARHRLQMVEIPIGITATLDVTDRIRLQGGISVLPGYVLRKESYAHAFESHHSAMHHRYSGFKGKTKAYNHFILSGGLEASVAYRLAPHFSVFAGGGYQQGLSNVYSDQDVHSKIRALRLSIGIKNQLF